MALPFCKIHLPEKAFAAFEVIGSRQSTCSRLYLRLKRALSLNWPNSIGYWRTNQLCKQIRVDPETARDVLRVQPYDWTIALNVAQLSPLSRAATGRARRFHVGS